MTRGVKIAKGILFVLVLVGLLTAFYFALEHQDQQKIKGFTVKIHTLNEDDFLSDKELKNIILASLDTFVGLKTENVQLAAIEKVAKKQIAVKDAAAFMSVDGRVFLEVQLRTALARIKPNTTEGFYLDSDGKVMNWVSSHTPRVLTITGFFSKYPRDFADRDSSKLSKKLIRDAYEFSKLVYEDEFWSKQLVQVYINPKGDAELITLLGDQKIVFGELNNSSAKLDKLMLFYKEIAKKVGWDKYQEVNVKFDKQIVCKK